MTKNTPIWATIYLAHPGDCAACLECAKSAQALAISTGSLGASNREGDHEGQVYRAYSFFNEAGEIVDLSWMDTIQLTFEERVKLWDLETLQRAICDEGEDFGNLSIIAEELSLRFSQLKGKDN